MKTFELQEIRPKIFLMLFENHYDLAMHFVRYQEFYESPSEDFRGKAFDLITFMRWYSLTYGNGVFTYATDWEGFNISGNIIKQVWDLGISDRNIYDYEMLNVYRTCLEQVGENFYLIGAPIDDDTILQHEIAHGFFYTLPDYKEEMSDLVKSLDGELYDCMIQKLKEMGYTSEVYVDEIQAYMATGLPFNYDELDATTKKLENNRKPFIKLFEKYYKS